MPGTTNSSTVLCLDTDWAKIDHQREDNPKSTCHSNHCAYVIYTSGSTGKPKGVLHTTGGYLLYAAMTHKYVFDYHEGDVYWCTADIGWVTGHSYIIYGPLANGATTLMFEGVPNFPDASRFWQVVDKWKVNSFYTAPTAIRMLMGQGDDFVKKPGNGITMLSVTSNARSWILGGKPKPVAI